MQEGIKIIKARQSKLLIKHIEHNFTVMCNLYNRIDKIYSDFSLVAMEEEYIPQTVVQQTLLLCFMFASRMKEGRTDLVESIELLETLLNDFDKYTKDNGCIWGPITKRRIHKMRLALEFLVNVQNEVDSMLNVVYNSINMISDCLND